MRGKLKSPLLIMKELGIEDLLGQLVFLAYVEGYVEGHGAEELTESEFRALLDEAVQKAKKHVEELEAEE